jgi:hypothetical protein
MATDIQNLFLAIGLPSPEPVPLLTLDHQIAQKLHACTSIGAGGENERAHDLVDLQILVREESPDLATAGSVARRLFLARHAQAWPPVVIAYPSWQTIYADAAQGLDVMPDVDHAVKWTNDLISRMR